MPLGRDTAPLWRTKAEEARAVAEQLSDPQLRKSMLKIAQAYEHLAASVEKQRAIYAKVEARVTSP